MKNYTLKFVIAFAAVTLISCSESNGQSDENKRKDRQPPSVEELFSRMDANKDGQLAKAEVKGPLKNDFAKIDLNEDKFITKEELEKAPKPKRQRPSREKK